MKIGRYDRAPALLARQETKAANGRIIWSPAMLQTVRATRERAARAAGEGGAPSLLTRYVRIDTMGGGAPWAMTPCK